MLALIRLLRFRYLLISTTVGGSYLAHKVKHIRLIVFFKLFLLQKNKEVQEKLSYTSWIKEYVSEENTDASSKHSFRCIHSPSVHDTVKNLSSFF